MEKIISFQQGQEIGSKLERLHEYLSEYPKGKKNYLERFKELQRSLEKSVLLVRGDQVS